MKGLRVLLGAVIVLFSLPAWAQTVLPPVVTGSGGSSAIEPEVSSVAPLAISLITILPGDPIYSAFGHSALRVQDSESGADLVYDFGQSQVPFNAAFVPLFLMGDMPFMVAVIDTDRGFDFWRRVERRTVLEQRIDLSPREAETLYADLKHHALPANRGYIYDFFYDNCATRVRDVLEEVMGESLGLRRQPQASLSFRAELRPYLEQKPIMELGIMLILGPLADAVPTDREVLFLPVRLMEAFGDAVVVFDGDPPRVGPLRAFLAPVTWALLGVALVITFVRRIPGIVTYLVDSVLFGGAGLLGLVMVALWAFSGYEPTYWNLNLLWAWPLHVVVPFVPAYRWRPGRSVRLIRGYLWVTTVASVFFVVSGPFLVQYVPATIVPMILALGVRSAARALRVSDKSSRSVLTAGSLWTRGF